MDNAEQMGKFRPHIDSLYEWLEKCREDKVPPAECIIMLLSDAVSIAFENSNADEKEIEQLLFKMLKRIIEEEKLERQ